MVELYYNPILYTKIRFPQIPRYHTLSFVESLPFTSHCWKAQFQTLLSNYMPAWRCHQFLWLLVPFKCCWCPDTPSLWGWVIYQPAYLTSPLGCLIVMSNIMCSKLNFFSGWVPQKQSLRQEFSSDLLYWYWFSDIQVIYLVRVLRRRGGK